MSTTATRFNPFVLMLDPEAVISAVEASPRLRGLRARVCRPLDKPLIPMLCDDAEPKTEAFMETGWAPYRAALH